MFSAPPYTNPINPPDTPPLHCDPYTLLQLFEDDESFNLEAKTKNSKKQLRLRLRSGSSTCAPCYKTDCITLA